MLVDLQRAAPDNLVPAADLTSAEDKAAPPPCTAERFRQGLQHLARGVSVVTSADDDAWYGVTTTSVCALSFDPPVLIACVSRRSSLGQQLGRTRRFCVNLPSVEQRAIAEAFSTRHGGSRPEGFRHGQWVRGTTGSPVLNDCLASFECAVDLMYGYCGHIAVIGHVLHVGHAASS